MFFFPSCSSFCLLLDTDSNTVREEDDWTEKKRREEKKRWGKWRTAGVKKRRRRRGQSCWVKRENHRRRVSRRFTLTVVVDRPSEEISGSVRSLTGSRNSAVAWNHRFSLKDILLLKQQNLRGKSKEHLQIMKKHSLPAHREVWD